ncbi:MAG TPA: response regulator transcription factor, partial [Conexibacter sp.]|nr:response regulator transcription factor [Conexibacter sp.]
MRVNAVALPPQHTGKLWEMEEPELSAAPVRVLVVDDHDVFRHGLAQLLRDEGIDVVAEASSGAAGVRLATELQPDVVLMDLSMPGISGVEATRAIVGGAASSAVVVLTL